MERIEGNVNDSLTMEMLAYSDNPRDRYRAAQELEFAQMLNHDESWLVRNTAKRTLLRGEREEQYSVHLLDELLYPFSGISEMIYELYKADWLSKHVASHNRTALVYEWIADCILAGNRGGMPLTFNEWEYVTSEEADHSEFYLSYTRFCGCDEPNGIGLYQDREFVAALVHNDKVLMEMYDADMGGAYKGPHHLLTVDELLKDASSRSISNSELDNQKSREMQEKEW